MIVPLSGPPWRACAAAGVLLAGAAVASVAARASSPTPLASVAAATSAPEPSPVVGRVVYRASKAGSYESLGVPVIACRHRDPGARTIGVDFFDARGDKVLTFGPTVVPNIPPGKKVVFVADATYYPNRDVINARVGHFTTGSARVVSDARIIHCMARMRFKPGARIPTYWRGMGLYREGVGATPVPVDW